MEHGRILRVIVITGLQLQEETSFVAGEPHATSTGFVGPEEIPVGGFDDCGDRS